MAKPPMEDELLAVAAKRHGVPLEVLVALLELEGEFGNLASPAAKGEFSRHVEGILDQASARAVV